MKTPLNRSTLAASLVLIGVTAMGCGAVSGVGGVGEGGEGGEVGAPTDASEKEFCDNLNSLYENLGAMADASDKEAIAAIKDWGTSLEEVGTPESISDTARQGFEVIVKQIGDFDENGSTDDFNKLEDELSKSDKDAGKAFAKYTEDTCGQPGDKTP